MGYDLVFSPEALEDLQRLRAYDRAIVKEAVERHLRFEPTRASRSRIKRLRGSRRPGYRLRVGAIRVFYDVMDARVEILAIVSKSDAEEWLDQAGEET